MSDSNVQASGTPPIAGWRDVVAVLRNPGLRVPMVFALLLTAETYLACLAVALWVTQLVSGYVVQPLLAWAFGYRALSAAMQVALGCVLSTPLYLANVKLAYRFSNWLEARRLAKDAGGPDGR